MITWILDFASFRFRSSPNQAEEDRVAVTTGSQTQSHDRPSYCHHSDRSDRHQGTRCRSTVPSSFRGGRSQGSTNTTTTLLSHQGLVRNSKTWSSPRTLAQVTGRSESTVQRVGPGIRAWAVSLPRHPLNSVFELRFIFSSLHFIYYLLSITPIVLNKDIASFRFYDLALSFNFHPS